MPARKKSPGTQQDRRPQRARVTSMSIVPADETKVPSLPVVAGGLLKATGQAWTAFWRSAPAAATEDVDLVLAERWILAYDEYRRALNAVRRRRLVEGSTGQPVLNPLASWVASREAAMHKAEAQLGIGTKARIDLGISVGQARLTAEQLNRMTEENDADDVVDAEEAELLAEFDTAEGSAPPA